MGKRNNTSEITFHVLTFTRQVVVVAVSLGEKNFGVEAFLLRKLNHTHHLTNRSPAPFSVSS